MKKIFLLFSLFFLPGTSAQDSVAKHPAELNINFMLRGYFYAGSKIPDKNAPGGYWVSGNYPIGISESDNFEDDEFYLLVLENSDSLFSEKYKGINLLLINSTGSTVSLPAEDSRINIVCQAFYEDEWKDIEYLPHSWCGNSYHKVYIPENHYWNFTAPKYSGNIKTRFRFILYRIKQSPLISNEFEGSFNLEQLSVKQGHIPTDIMDPYID